MPNGDLDRQLEICQTALAARDLPHALRHLGDALAIAPLDERAHALIESAARLGDIAAQLKPDFLGNALLLAFAHRRLGRTDEAVRILAQCCDAGRGLETLLASWLDVMHAQGEKLSLDSAQRIGVLLVTACSSTVGLHRLFPGERALVEGFADLAAAVVLVTKAPSTLSMASGALRRAQRFDEALAIPLPDHVEDRRYALIQRGLCLRAMGKADEAAQAFVAALAITPGDHDLTAEQARCCFVAGDFDRALELLGKLDREGELDPERLAFAGLCRSRPDGDRIEMLDRIRRSALQPETPRDATVAVLRQLYAESKSAAGCRVAVSGWEPPSDRLLVALSAAGSADVMAAPYDYKPVERDFKPMSLRRGATLAAWVVREGIPAPFAGPPLEELRVAIGKISIPDDSLIALWDRAAELGKNLSPRLARDIVAAMIHPPTNAEWLAALPDVLYRHRVAAACVLANLPAPWSEIRPLFESLLFGPIDWISGAAVTALGELAKRDANHARDLRDLLCSVVSDLIIHDCEPRRGALQNVFATLPAIPQTAQDELRTKVPSVAAQAPKRFEKPVDEEERAIPIGKSAWDRWVWRIFAFAFAGGVLWKVFH